MAQGFIDWASLTEVANSYAGPMRDAYRWSAVSSIQATCGIVHGRQFRVLPSPGSRRLSTKGPHDVLRMAVTDLVDSAQLPSNTVDRTATDVKRWAQDNTTRLRQIVDTCMSDPDKLYGPKCGFDQWLATALGANREATTLRVGGLFDLSLRAPLSAVLEVGDQELARAWEHSSEAATLGTDSDLYELVSRAHVLSILLRGRYHDLVARSAGIQVMHHPIRGPLLPELPEADLPPVPYELTNSERFMAQLLWASGFAERDADRRIRLWADNVRLVRTAVLAELIDLPHRTSETRALDTAVDAARNAGVRAHSRLVDDGIDLLLAAGVGALTSFVVNGWPDMVTTLATYAGSRKEQLGARVAKQVFDSNRRLRHLAETPGRVTGRFASPGEPRMAGGDA
ncbi:hypothetical protein GCM10010435_57710 [Winogradskya consettensis]|uniref:Uncharacterized protein n=1 Tax=Winogradskya consettensis TaxID=113560 RepID=A0A919VKY5_9ACTN|nr:hypothetical protein [Actinoplanes consettensis]GIM67062.1 hypothetical protein Aco04nite_04610 [Actinoplanes consettensis]